MNTKTDRTTALTQSINKLDYLLVFALFPLLLLLYLLHIYQPTGVYWQLTWVPSLDLNLSFSLDALSFLFASLITGIGFLIQIYAWDYLRKHPARLSFHLYLTLFMLAMLGLVCSDNILLMFIFWELTTLTSYFLIGFNHSQAQSRRNALQSLVITGAGGLVLLAGLILLGEMAGSYQLSLIINQANNMTSHPWFTASFILIFIGAITKSAQFPFHFWLPNAMAAPTPVSAYLHSATMVKAGIYLLARLSPVYASTEMWFYTLIFFGAITAIWCSVLALKQTDLKLMLAYSTNVALAKMLMLLGLGTELAITALLLFIMAHAFYKAALFMVVGNVDKATGTRELGQLQGLNKVMFVSFLIAVIAALSKSGLPPFMGFLSKEYMYKSALDISLGPSIIFMIINILMVALAFKFIIVPFLAGSDNQVTQAKKIDSVALLGPPFILATLSFLVPLVGLSWLNHHIIVPGLVVIAQSSTTTGALLWQGFNLPLLLSVLTLVLGFVCYLYWSKLATLWQGTGIRFISADKVFDTCLSGLFSLASALINKIQKQTTSLYVLAFCAVLAGLLLSQLSMPLPVTWQHFSEINSYDVLIAVLVVIAALLCAITESRLLAVLALGMMGFMTTLVFMLYSAPDVAKTLLLVETLMMVFVVIVLRHMPALSAVVKHTFKRRLLHGLIAGIIGLSVTLLLINITQSPFDNTLTDFFAQNSVPGGHGRNIVNVILVDFRAFDTLGEIIVVVISAFVAVSLLPKRTAKVINPKSLIFTTTAHFVATLMLVFSFYLLLRGHNAPGGGFIAALVAVIGFALLTLAESVNHVRQRLYFSPSVIALTGILLSIGAGLIGVLHHTPFLTGIWWPEILPIGTPLIFDVGIYLAIIGSVTGMVLHVNEELD
ncbi:hydrogen gas-evolving membrane-bound hydrogenase subunit E [Motilimonas sp. KMU-193]|uniref:hydrogen gas-evolving membrane-bound hydrogenase subunit E n=1 Tax=Motilimonas sp. KMU-193 TaxID=3388668 RepID=UPI00396AF26B